MSLFCSGTLQIRNLDGAPDRTRKTLFIGSASVAMDIGGGGPRYWGLACREKGPVPVQSVITGTSARPPLGEREASATIWQNFLSAPVPTATFF
jgi:hypothetical protein